MSKLHKHGLVLGKFMPLHIGHQALFQFAMRCCEHITIIIDHIKNQSIDLNTRKKWVQQLYPQATVICLPSPMPQLPQEHQEFWAIWTQTIQSVLSSPLDVCIGSEPYIALLAQHLSCEHIQYDRGILPISASHIKKEPLTYWNYLSKPARNTYQKHIRFIGPESTGKSTCAQQIATAFQSMLIPEYAKTLIEAQNGSFHYHDVLPTAQSQINGYLSAQEFSNYFVIHDTDALTAKIWSLLLFNQYPGEIDAFIDSEHFDLTFLFAVDHHTPFVPALHRPCTPPLSERHTFFHTIKTHLEARSEAFIIIDGNYNDRFLKCYSALSNLKIF